MIDARVSAGFFRASAPAGGTGGFEGAIRSLAQLPSARDRERDLGQGVIIRIERATETAEYIEGEFSRIQKANIPSQASSEGLLPLVLQDGHGLAHVAAFLYHRPSRVLLLQRNSQSATVNRLSLYVAADNAGNLVTFAPVITEDALERFKHGEPRSFSVKFSGIDQLQALDDAGIAVAKGARMIGEAYDGVEVEIRVSAGRSRKSFLGKARLMPEVEQLAGLPGVDHLTAKLSGDPTAVDLLNEHMKEARVLDLPEGDPDAHFERRRAFLRAVFSDKLAEIQRRFGP